YEHGYPLSTIAPVDGGFVGVEGRHLDGGSFLRLGTFSGKSSARRLPLPLPDEKCHHRQAWTAITAIDNRRFALATIGCLAVVGVVGRADPVLRTVAHTADACLDGICVLGDDHLVTTGTRLTRWRLTSDELVAEHRSSVMSRTVGRPVAIPSLGEIA